MERQKHLQMGIQDDDQEKQNEGKGVVVREMNQKVQLNVAATHSPPPSASSSPSHEFSFTISLHPSADALKILEKNTSPHPLAIDLSPADDIFFGGQLLPLHRHSHPPVSPRSSTNSLDSFTIPINEFSDYNDSSSNFNNSIGIDSTRSDDIFINGDDDMMSDHCLSCQEGSKGRRKSKTFSLFGLPKWRKGNEAATKSDNHRHHHQQQQDSERQKRKVRIDMSNVVKKYMRLVKPFLFLRRGSRQIHRPQPYSFSGNLQVKNKELRKRRGEYSAPASMRTSPTNSGLLVASGTATPTKSDSTMEELQAAIQAAIAHCKKSIAASEESKMKNNQAAAMTT